MGADAIPQAELPPLAVIQSYRVHDGTLRDLVASRREAGPGRPMLCDTRRSWNWLEMEADVLRLTAGLQARGVVAGDRVVIVAENSGWHILVLQALARLGAAMVPINPSYRVGEMAHVLVHSRPRLILFDELSEPVLTEIAATMLTAERHRLDDELLNLSEPAAQADPDPNTTLVIIYTSGTTGAPKGVLHSQANVVAAGEAFVQRLHLQPDERMLAILPLFHINALFYSVAGALAAGARLVVEPRFSASRFWPLIARERITQVNVIEAIVTILLKRPEHEYVPSHGLRKVYGVRDRMVVPMRERFGVPHLVGGYAMTEIPGVLNTAYDGPNRSGSMGQISRHPDPARDWAECRVVDMEGSEVPAGVAGELQVRTPIVMQGYFDDPEQTSVSFDGSWFRTGDLVRRDEEGFYYFIARLKDIIRRRGENISGAELDQVVSEHPDVLHAAAIGVDSPFGDQDIMVVAVPKSGATPTAESIAEWCAQRLAAAKRPRYVVFVDQLPMTPTHKVAKPKLRQATTELLAAAVDLS